MHTIWTTAGSVLFGLIALIVPFIGAAGKNRPAFTAVSFSACGIALCIQIYYAAMMVKQEAWSALIDTMDATVFVSAALLVITIMLNLFFIIKRKQGKRSQDLA